MDRQTPGRNDPCRCGSKKKYKSCCWEKDRSKRLESIAPAAAQAPAPEGAAGGKSDKPQGQTYWQIVKDRHPGKKR